LTVATRKFAIIERRRQVTSMLAQAKTEVEIANALGVDQTTVSLNVKALKEPCQVRSRFLL
jgi:DNA-binding NarL/FixJ family response regulator